MCNAESMKMKEEEVRRDCCDLMQNDDLAN